MGTSCSVRGRAGMGLDRLRLSESSCTPSGTGSSNPSAFIEGLFREVKAIRQDWGLERASGPKLLQTRL